MANVEIRENIPLKGRGLFATQDITQDVVLFDEKPLVCAQFVWNAVYKYLACDHCLKSLETAQENARRLAEQPHLELPYPECCEVAIADYVQCPQCEIWYCSAECRDAALDQYHHTLCLGPHRENPKHPINILTDMWKEIHHPPETTSITLILRMLAMVKQAKDKSAVVQRLRAFCSATHSDTAGLAHKILGKNFQAQLDMLREQLQQTLYVEEVQDWYTPEGFISLFAMLGTNGQGVGTSTLSLYTKKLDEMTLAAPEKEKVDDFLEKLYDRLFETAGEFLNVEGSALYSLQSTCNHSCEPNAEVQYPHNNATLQVKTLKPIEAGEEITICYLDPCQKSRGRYSRQKFLKENYLFTCDCSKCLEQADDADVTTEEEMDSEDEDDVVSYGEEEEEGDRPME